MSSRIQKPRPCVAAMRSEQRQVLSSFTWRSRTEIAGMSRRSDCQWSPSSNETHTCASVAAYSSPFLRGSSRMEFATAPARCRCRSPSSSCRHRACARSADSCRRARIVFAAAYAVRSSKCPASMLKMRVHGLIAARCDVGPRRAAIRGHLDVAVVGAGPEHADAPRRRRERGDRALRRG